MGHTCNRWVKIILVKNTLCFTEKCQKNHRFISWQSPVKVKKVPQKIKQFLSRTCCKQSWPLPFFYWLVITVPQQCADGMATM